MSIIAGLYQPSTSDEILSRFRSWASVHRNSEAFNTIRNLVCGEVHLVGKTYDGEDSTWLRRMASYQHLRFPLEALDASFQLSKWDQDETKILPLLALNKRHYRIAVIRSKLIDFQFSNPINSNWKIVNFQGYSRIQFS